MHNDEQAIRDVIAQWQSASASGDADRLQTLMADDVIFLRPGQPPLCGKHAFMAAFKEGLKNFHIESHAEIKEIQIAADLAYCWTQLLVTIMPLRAGLPMTRSGNTLSILQKKPGGSWVLLRDANMLSPKPAAPA